MMRVTPTKLAGELAGSQLSCPNSALSRLPTAILCVFVRWGDGYFRPFMAVELTATTWQTKDYTPFTPRKNQSL
jgi:hypothetical protein